METMRETHPFGDTAAEMRSQVKLNQQWWQEIPSEELGPGSIIDAIAVGQKVNIDPERNVNRVDFDPRAMEIVRVAGAGIGIDATRLFCFLVVDVEDLSEDLFYHRVTLYGDGSVHSEEEDDPIGWHTLSIPKGR